MRQSTYALLLDESAEDRQQVAAVLCYVLPNLGIIECDSPSELEALLARPELKLVFVEQQLSWGDGLAAIRAAEKPGLAHPVIVLSHDDSAATAIAALRAGAADYLVKTAAGLARLAEAAQTALASTTVRFQTATPETDELAEQTVERLTRLQAITTALSGALRPTEIAKTVLEQGVVATGAAAGEIVLLRDEATTLDLLGYVGSDAVERTLYRRFAASGSNPFAQTVTTNAALWFESRDEFAERYPQLAPLCEPSEGQAWAFLPLIVKGSAVGCLGLCYGEPRRFHPNERQFLDTLAQQFAQALERAQLYEMERAARALTETIQQRLTFLDELGGALSDTLDYQALPQLVARQIVPKLADLCVLYAYEPNKRLRRLAYAYSDPSGAELLAELIRLHPLDQAPGAVVAVVRSGQSTLEQLSEAEQQATTPNTTKLNVARALDLRSSVVVPLVARQRIIGALELATGAGRRRFERSDLSFAEEVARRVALALDNGRLYAEAQEAVQLRDTFFSIAAHELRTPLTALLGQAQLLQRRAVLGEPLSERSGRAIGVVAEQSKRLNRMITEMLDVARLARGQLTVELSLINFAALVQRVVEEVEASLVKHQLHYKGLDEPITMQGDAARLEQVVQNLLQNAVKYSPDGGTITVRVWRENGNGCVTVADQGIGIPAEALPQLFQRFFRAENSAAYGINGMGVGLYVVKEIVERHGGSLTVASEEGQGSAFTVCLPLRAPQNA